jgi:hypothetical protein
MCEIRSATKYIIAVQGPFRLLVCDVCAKSFGESHPLPDSRLRPESRQWREWMAGGGSATMRAARKVG